jgi:hypothetical protein
MEIDDRALHMSFFTACEHDLCYSMPFININERNFDFSRYDEIKEKWHKVVDFTNNLVLFHSNYVCSSALQLQHICSQVWPALC